MVLLLGGAIFGIGLLFFLPLTVALLLASILTPTDPVSVVSNIKQATGDEGLVHTVEGESMLKTVHLLLCFSYGRSTCKKNTQEIMSTELNQALCSV